MCPRTKPALRGICLLNGQHPPGSQLARECPVLRAKVGSGASKSTSEGGDSREPVLAQKRTGKTESSNTVFRYSRAKKPGRPKLSIEEQLQRARERARKRRMPR